MPVQYQNRNYDFLDDAYSGGGGFLTGQYLLRHPREEDAKYGYRQELSYYSNFVKPVVDSLTNPIFRKMIARDWSRETNQFIGPFMHDVDRLGSTINRFMKNAARYARLYGSVFIMVDNSREVAGDTLSALGERNFPYVYFVKPNQVIEYKSDEYGRLKYIKYKTYESCTKILGTTSTEDENVWEWWPDHWKLTYHDGSVEENENKLGFIPMVTLYGTDADLGDFLPLSPMMSIARTNLAIFNLCSELRELLRNQAFSILCFPITQDVDINKMREGLNLGTDNMLIYDGNSSKAPFFITPSAEQANLLQNEINRLIEDIYRQANLTGVASVQQRTSGVARQWDFEQTNQSLADMAENCEIAEREIIKCFCAYLGHEAKKLEYKVIYPRDFGIVDVSGELDKVAQALSLNVGSEFDKQVKIKAAEAYLSNIPDREYKEVITQIRDNSDDEAYSAQENPNAGTYNPVSAPKAPDADERIGDYLQTKQDIKTRKKERGDG